MDFKRIEDTATTFGHKATRYAKSHWGEYLIIAFILLLLGAFDSLVLKRSDNLFNDEYWIHACTRIGAYALASALGLRIAYPKVKEGCKELQEALEYNSKLIPLRRLDFDDFIKEINVETKILAWKSKINRKLLLLDKHSPRFFPFYYDSKNENGQRSDEFFKGYKIGRVREKIRALADKYCEKRSTLEALLDDEYIKANIQTLDVKYPVVNKHHFDNVEQGVEDYKQYVTVGKTATAKIRAVGNSVIFTVISALVLGGIAVDFNSAIAQEQIIGVFSAIINGIIDVGMVVFRVINGTSSAEKIVRSEELRAVVDKNELMIRYCTEKGIEYPGKNEKNNP